MQVIIIVGGVVRGFTGHGGGAALAGVVLPRDRVDPLSLCSCRQRERRIEERLPLRRHFWSDGGGGRFGGHWGIDGALGWRSEACLDGGAGAHGDVDGAVAHLGRGPRVNDNFGGRLSMESGSVAVGTGMGGLRAWGVQTG